MFLYGYKSTAEKALIFILITDCFTIITYYAWTYMNYIIFVVRIKPKQYGRNNKTEKYFSV